MPRIAAVIIVLVLFTPLLSADVYYSYLVQPNPPIGSFYFELKEPTYLTGDVTILASDFYILRNPDSPSGCQIANVEFDASNPSSVWITTNFVRYSCRIDATSWAAGTGFRFDGPIDHPGLYEQGMTTLLVWSDSPQPQAPEPASMMLLATGGIAAWKMARKRKT